MLLGLIRFANLRAFTQGCISRGRMTPAAILVIVLLTSTFFTHPAQAQTLSVLYSFQGVQRGEKLGDGATSWAGLIRDAEGNLYGTTYAGGIYNRGGYGTVFKVDPSGTETVLHRFTGGRDGIYPAFGSLLLNSGGSLYGTTSYGGASSNGIIFRVDPAGKETVLYAFSGETDGGAPYSGLISDADGNLYGTTTVGGDLSCINDDDQPGCGTVFKFDKNGKETVLYSFTGTGGDGEAPWAGLTRDGQGNLYGTTMMGGDLSCTNPGGYPGCGTIFRLDSTGHETIVHTFVAADGSNPEGGPLTIDAAGNLYGTASSNGPNNSGTIYKVDTAGNYSVLYAFPDESANGEGPNGELLIGDGGNIYGVTTGGGTNDYGVLFELLPTGYSEIVLHKFGSIADDGLAPYAGVIADPKGDLYGTTQYGGSAGEGVVYKLTN